MASSDAGDVTPEELLRALLSISPEDAHEVRKQADVKARPAVSGEPLEN